MDQSTRINASTDFPSCDEARPCWVLVVMREVGGKRVLEDRYSYDSFEDAEVAFSESVRLAPEELEVGRWHIYLCNGEDNEDGCFPGYDIFDPLERVSFTLRSPVALRMTDVSRK